jgi:hypothetical protein
LLYNTGLLKFPHWTLCKQPGKKKIKKADKKRQNDCCLYNEGECVLFGPVGRLSGEGAIFCLPLSTPSVRLSFLAPFVNSEKNLLAVFVAVVDWMLIHWCSLERQSGPIAAPRPTAAAHRTCSKKIERRERHRLKSKT